MGSEMRRSTMIVCFPLLSSVACSGYERGSDCGLNFGGLPVPGCQSTPSICTKVSWILVIPNAELDPNAVPPQARLRVGGRGAPVLWPINLEGAGCSPGLMYDAAFMSSDPAVAVVEYIGSPAAPSAQVRAVSPGDTVISAASVQTPTGPIQARLGYCPGGAYSNCVPVNLILRVIP